MSKFVPLSFCAPLGKNEFYRQLHLFDCQKCAKWLEEIVTLRFVEPSFEISCFKTRYVVKILTSY